MSAFQRSGALWLPPQPPPEPEPPVTIRMVDGVRRAGDYGSWRMSWNVEAELATVVGPVPYNLFLAKARKLCDRELLHGCPCGCRGDFHPPEECQGC